jgi:hypothetical protein
MIETRLQSLARRRFAASRRLQGGPIWRRLRGRAPLLDPMAQP